MPRVDPAAGHGNLIWKGVRIVDESPDWIVLDKPPFLQVHPHKPDGGYTLWHGLRELLAYEMVNGGQISIINRLDRETSGLTLVCKNTATARQFSQLMERHGIHKEYLAIVRGWPALDSYDIQAPLARVGEHGPSLIWHQRGIHPLGATARTRVRVEKRFLRGDVPFSLVRAFPETGRTHQIRVHLAHIGHSIVGDKIYGPGPEHYLRFIETGWTQELADVLLMPRHALHSVKLHAGDRLPACLGQQASSLLNEWLWESELPPDMVKFIEDF